MLPRDFKTTPFSFRVLNVSASLLGSTLTTQLNPTNLVHVLYMTLVLEQTWCSAFQASGGIMPSSLFIRSMPKSQSWLRCRLSTCFPSLKENAECGIQTQFQTQLLWARQVSDVLAESITDNCMPLQVLVEKEWYLCSFWLGSSPGGSGQLSLWDLRSQNNCVFCLSSAKMFSCWGSSSDLCSSGGKPEVFWFILSFQWHKWDQNLVIFPYRYHLC